MIAAEVLLLMCRSSVHAFDFLAALGAASAGAGPPGASDAGDARADAFLDEEPAPAPADEDAWWPEAVAPTIFYM